MQKMLASGRLETTEMVMETLGRFFQVACTPILNKQGELEMVIHIATDITKLRQAEKASHENEVISELSLKIP